MNTEKSIKLMNVIKSILPEHYNFDFGKPEIDEVIKRLQMWEEFKKKYNKNDIIILEDYGRGLGHFEEIKYKVDERMDAFEKEYFSKPGIRKEIRVEVLAENEDVIDELAKEIEDVSGQQFRAGKIRVVNTRWERE